MNLTFDTYFRLTKLSNLTSLQFFLFFSACLYLCSEILMKKQGRQKRNIARQVAIFGCQRLGLHKQKDIAEYFSLSHRGSVSSAISAIEGSIESGDLKNHFNQIRRNLNFTKRTWPLLFLAVFQRRHQLIGQHCQHQPLGRWYHHRRFNRFRGTRSGYSDVGLEEP